MAIEEVDTVALGLYLAILYQDRRGELLALGLDQLVQKRLHPKAKKILITTEEVLEPGDKTTSKFYPREQEPTAEQERLMLALALEQGILATFKSHYYSFDQGEVRLQEEGGPIGLIISGAAGKVSMLAWLRDFFLMLSSISTSSTLTIITPSWRSCPWAPALWTACSR